jgi:hypothetical protein
MDRRLAVEPPESTDQTHVCPVCGETVDPGDLGAEFWHRRPAHRYDGTRRPRAGLAAASLIRAWNATGNNSRN